MNTIQKLKNDTLILTTKELVSEERAKTLEVIEHLQEIYNRRLHMKLGHSSMHEFLVRELKYSDGAAHRRISAMRLVQTVPPAKAAIADGRLSLTTASQVQSFFRIERQKNRKSYSNAEKLAILETVAGTSKQECAKKLCEISPTFAAQESEIKLIEDTELKSLMDEYRLLAMLSDSSVQSIVKSALRTAIQSLRAKQGRKDVSKAASPEKLLQNSRYIPKATKQAVWKNSNGRCEYTNPATQIKCQSSNRLEIDHVKPLVLDGETRTENLRMLCYAHHRLLTIETFGLKT